MTAYPVINFQIRLYWAVRTSGTQTADNPYGQAAGAKGSDGAEPLKQRSECDSRISRAHMLITAISSSTRMQA